ncbi:VIP36-like protein isoform X3 [Acipenser ruthenus]|uniref:VIP36-like protein isoform X3 n=1 Tax=Acipenser ruthenus TaxID=7906 RepID=UPI0027406D12|nr:VIP36-like protein isoform X3 [Acipenser ruthenus]
MAAAVRKKAAPQRFNGLYRFVFNRQAGLKMLFLISVCFVFVARSGGEEGHQTEEFLKREFSLTKPYQGVGSSSSSHWELLGNAMVSTQQLRLTPDMQSKQGAVWNRTPCFLRDWELQVHFKVHGQGKKNLNGDGFAVWYTRERMQTGPVFGNKDNFTGLGVFVDTYPNEEKQKESQKRRFSPSSQRLFPLVLAMVGNGSLSYDHERDGRPTELGSCTALVRNLNHDSFLVVRYVRRRLTVMIDIDGKHEWRDCLDVPGVRLPLGYYFGVSSVTGDLSDNHDLISLKLYQLTVERSEEEELLDKEVFIPSVDNWELLRVLDQAEPMGTLSFFLLVLFSILGCIILAILGVITYQKWSERDKRFY